MHSGCEGVPTPAREGEGRARDGKGEPDAARSGVKIALLNRLSSHAFGTIWCNIDMFHLKLLINFLSLTIAGQINWHVVEFSELAGSMLKPNRSLVSFQ